jgi:cell fate regulator YaaT (PSP1 superfamily)
MVQSTISLEDFFAEPPPVRSRGGCGSCGKGSASGEESRCGNGLEKIYPTTAVRFGYLRYIGEFSHAPDMKFTCGAKVVIQTRRGVEIGEQVSLTCHGCDKSVTREQMKSWVASCGEDSFLFDAGRILREASAADLADYARIQEENRAKRTYGQDLSRRAGLNLKVVECETLFGGERIILYFRSEDRIDFRSLVKDLAKEYRTRIEMRQIGARDEARLMADYETCGREVCCKVFLKTLKPISMRMAKLQKATLDPTQVSGRCGRLKCCLRYEHEGYEELDKKLPRVGLRIRTSHGDGVIVNRQVLTQLVQIRTDADKLLTVVAEDILAIGVPEPSGPAADASPSEAPRPRVSANRPRPAPPIPRRPGEAPPRREPPAQGEGVRRPAGPTPGPKTGGPSSAGGASRRPMRRRPQGGPSQPLRNNEGDGRGADRGEPRDGPRK